MENRLTSVMDVLRDGKFCYQIHLTNSFDSLSSEGVGKELLEGRRACIVTDSTVGGLYAEAVERELKKICSHVTVFTFAAGEASKTLDTVRSLYEHLILEGFDRKDILVALGGGVVGDLTGFTAATYLRGIDFIQIPTTLLAQVDSSIGGKTGVDFDCYKNMVGAFHMPRLVYMNLSVLKSLSERQFACGMAEIIKHGLIRNRAYYEWLHENRESILARDYGTLLKMVEESCFVKRDVVQRDPTEKGDRALLNFGHTIGHAVEKLKNFQMLHGECVAVGSAAAAYISCRRGYLTEEELTEILNLFRAFSLPVQVEGISGEEVLRTTRMDKKMEAGKIRFVLLKEIGDAFTSKDVTDGELLEAIAYINS